MDVLLQMVLAGSGVAMLYDLEVEEHRRAGPGIAIRTQA